MQPSFHFGLTLSVRLGDRSNSTMMVVAKSVSTGLATQRGKDQRADLSRVGLVICLEFCRCHFPYSFDKKY